MGCQVEITDTGVEVQLHFFDTMENAAQYMVKSRGYVFDRHESWAFTAGFDFFNGQTSKDKACIRQALGGYWKCVFWTVESAVIKERERCAKIAEDVYAHTAGMTVERDMATRICPRIAKAIRQEP